MKRKALYLTVGFSVALTNVGLAQTKVPNGWFVAGSRAKEYVATVDNQKPHGGKGSAHFKSSVSKTTGFGTLMQTFQAGEFRGKRVRLTGYARSRDVDSAGLWMRVDGPAGKTLSFDNMHDRPIKGSSDWAKYEIVLNVPTQAEQIAYGVLLTGRGDVWLDDLKFDVVGDASATAADSKAGKIPDAPVNLDFEQN